MKQDRSRRDAVHDRAFAEGTFRLLLDAAPDAMVVVNRGGEIVLVNAQTERLFEYPRDELLFQGIEALLPERFRRDHRQEREIFDASPSIRAMGARRELFALTRSGREVPVEISLSPVETTGGMFIVAAVRDVTERKRIEDSLARQTRELAERNKELDNFVYVASHDLQEPLRKINAFGKLLASEYRESIDGDGKAYIDFMVDAAARMQILINDLLVYSRTSAEERPLMDVDLAAVVAAVLRDLSMRIADIDARIEVDELPTVEGDPMQMHELFLNLIGNALKFHARDRQPVVTVRSEPTARSGHKGRRREKACRIEVADNGVGFEPEYADQIFAPFKRLYSREEYEGTGVGLAICQKVVERHGGTIKAEGRPGTGATFTVILPVRHHKSPHKVDSGRHTDDSATRESTRHHPVGRG